MQSGLPFFRASLQVAHYPWALLIQASGMNFADRLIGFRTPLDQRSILNKQLISDCSVGFTILVRQQGNRVFVSKYHSTKSCFTFHPYIL